MTYTVAVFVYCKTTKTKQNWGIFEHRSLDIPSCYSENPHSTRLAGVNTSASRLEECSSRQTTPRQYRRPVFS